MAQITCNVCGKLGETLAAAPMGGEVGERILSTVCSDCWTAWVEQQARVINHYGLQLAHADDRKQLMGYMKEFLKLEPT